MSERITNPLSLVDAAGRVLAAQDGSSPVALATVISAPDREALGRRLLVTATAVTGTLGVAELDEQVVILAREALVTRERGLHGLEWEGKPWEVYVESQHELPDLLIVGAGHIARPLCRIASLMDFRVTVVDDRHEFADQRWFPEAARVQVVDFSEPFKNVRVEAGAYIVLVTRGHKYDYDCIQQLLELDARPAYLGMIGSSRRVRAAFEALIRDGIAPERLAEVHAPIGLDIGAETPGEIALAIAAELVAVRRGGSGGTLSDGEDVLGRVARAHEEKRGDGQGHV